MGEPLRYYECAAARSRKNVGHRHNEILFLIFIWYLDGTLTFYFAS
jgi:hypothetical protein